LRPYLYIKILGTDGSLCRNDKIDYRK